jgi:hypothetical protein
MGMLNQMFKDILEHNLGRIRWQSNMWAIVGSRWDKRRIENKNIAGSPRSNAEGNLFSDAVDTEQRLAVVVKKTCTPHCPNPPADDFYKTKQWHVPQFECRKCQFHVKAGRYRFPRCTFKTPKDAGREAAKQFGGMLQEATENAKALLEG